jgi:hypothetical protein
MIHLPPLNQARVVRITREGSVAWTPGLSLPRSLSLGTCDETARHGIEEVLQRAAQCGSEGGTCAQGGDQRFYRVDLVVDDIAKASPSISFEVPEDRAPEAFVRLWKGAG